MFLCARSLHTNANSNSNSNSSPSRAGVSADLVEGVDQPASFSLMCEFVCSRCINGRLRVGGARAQWLELKLELRLLELARSSRALGLSGRDRTNSTPLEHNGHFSNDCSNADANERSYRRALSPGRRPRGARLAAGSKKWGRRMMDRAHSNASLFPRTDEPANGGQARAASIMNSRAARASRLQGIALPTNHNGGRRIQHAIKLASRWSLLSLVSRSSFLVRLYLASGF